MAVNPNISLAVKGPQFNDPLAMYGKIAAIQGAQSQNQLAQYQLGAAQRTETRDLARMNALAAAGTDEAAIANALLKTGDIKGYNDLMKAAADRKTALLTQRKTEGEILDQVTQRYRDTLTGIDPASPTAGVQLMRAHKANHSDPVMQSYLKGLGVDPAQGDADVEAAIAKGPEGIADFIQRSSLKAKEFHDFNKPKWIGTGSAQVPVSEGTGRQLTNVPALPMTLSPDAAKPTVVKRNNGTEEWLERVSPQGGPGVEIEGTRVKMSMTPGQAAANRIAAEQLKVAQERLANQDQSVTYHTDSNGIIVALPSKLPSGVAPVARTAVAPGASGQPLAGKPSEAVTKELSSISQQRAIVKGALDALDKTPSAFGLGRGLAGETIGGRLSSDAEIQARSYLFNVVSGVIKERAGTAQTAGEAETLARFLPQPTDNADIIKGKMKAFDKYLVDKESGVKPGKAGATPSPVAPQSSVSGTPLPPGFQLDK